MGEALLGVGCIRGEACGVVFHHEERNISLAVHGDDFSLCGLEEDLFWTRGVKKSWFDIKVRAIVGGSGKTTKKWSSWVEPLDGHLVESSTKQTKGIATCC